MPTRPSPRTRTWLELALAVTVPLALDACGTGDGGTRDAATRTGALADTAALSATAGFVETSAAFTDAGILAMLDEANQSDSSAAALAIEKASDAEVKAFAAALLQVQGGAHADHARAKDENVGLEFSHPALRKLRHPKVECHLRATAVGTDANHCGSFAQTARFPAQIALARRPNSGNMDQSPPVDITDENLPGCVIPGVTRNNYLTLEESAQLRGRGNSAISFLRE